MSIICGFKYNQNLIGVGATDPKSKFKIEKIPKHIEMKF